mmetsp:Transcript_23194/g.64715  ORF Transcript_23194/g.64715 Transcript_23194/m.64715 type:complete len:300 (-) Transcript_23194:489-1388(-)|eukprot:CAMPEP_0198112672 /NCGR_PEP_ID=MMETSP1442-20131203/4481_1 /TAXON_ID= /ORGANISM="Craspedostauros australis, Strain CCMP3328" /LENGTH=299 /DNA_ID=CAMNT_0043769533 /DNA_START=200 /DNA_END=1099 /DNA_ORIENTATION=-
MKQGDAERSFRAVNGFQSLVATPDSGDTKASTAAAGDGPLLQWYCPPDGWTTESDADDTAEDAKAKREGRDGWWKLISVQVGNKLQIGAPAKKDFWRKTYYEPLLIKDDGPFLHTVVSQAHFPITITTRFTIKPNCQFDQVGVLLRLNHEHWIKTGIEVVDGVPRLSCVTTNGFSDWSTQTWDSLSACIRVHCMSQHGGSYVVEAASYPADAKDDKVIDWDSLDWTMMRICHMNKDMNHALLNEHPTVQNAFEGPAAPDGCIMAGLFAACPEDQKGTVATFDGLSITQGTSFEHNADCL